MTDRELMQQALEWADKHGEVVFAGGGMDAVDSMNEWTQAMRSRLAQSEQEPKHYPHTWGKDGERCVVCGDKDWMGTSCKATPPQPEQEPVAWQHRKPIMDSQGNTRGYYDWLPGKGLDRWPHRRLYTSPPQRKPLTDEKMKKIWYAMQNIMGWYSFQEIARAIEAAHGIKENKHD